MHLMLRNNFDRGKVSFQYLEPIHTGTVQATLDEVFTSNVGRYGYITLAQPADPKSHGSRSHHLCTNKEIQDREVVLPLSQCTHNHI